MSPENLAIAMLVTMIILVILGSPVAFTLGGLAVIFGIAGWGLEVLSIFPERIYTTMTAYSLIAVPLFVLMGAIIQASGVAERLYNSFDLLFGSIKGGLAIATMLLAILFGACTGVAGASVVTIGLLSLPAMLERGYNKELATGTILAGGGLGVIIPPSIMLILYGPVAGISISKLFSSALIPGILLGLAYTAYIAIRCYINPALSGLSPSTGKKEFHLIKVLASTCTSLLPTLFIILAVLGSIYFGIAAPTEAGAMGALGALLLMIIYRKFTIAKVKEASYMTIKATSMIMMLVVGAGLFTTVFLGMGGGDVIKEVILNLRIGTTGTVIFLLFLVLIMGMFMDWVGMLLILVPIYTPIISTLKVDSLWFAIAFCITLQISYITPPFAYSVFYLKGVAPKGVELSHMYRGAIPYILIQVFFLVLLFVFPQIIN